MSAPLLPASTTANLIPSIAFDVLLAQRNMAVLQLARISTAVAAYHAIGTTIWPRKSDEHGDAAPFTFREPVELRSSGRGKSLSDEKWLDDSVKALDASLWDRLLTESGLWSFFDSKARAEWREQINERKTPALTEENVRATFESLHAQRGMFFERGVVELFRSLSWDYKTNLPVKFGKRIILRFVTRGSGRADKLDDLDRAFHVLDEKPEPDHRSSIKARLWDRSLRLFETPYLRLKTFKNENGHVEFLRPELVDQLNAILAKHSPNALARASREAA